jgi:hypothetical protein
MNPDTWKEVVDAHDKLKEERIAKDPEFGRKIFLIEAEMVPILEDMESRGFSTHTTHFLSGYKDYRPIYDRLLYWFEKASHPEVKAKMLAPFQKANAKPWFDRLLEIYQATELKDVRIQLSIVFSGVTLPDKFADPVAELTLKADSDVEKGNLVASLAKIKGEASSEALIRVLPVLCEDDVMTALSAFKKRGDSRVSSIAQGYLQSKNEDLRALAEKYVSG